MLNVLSLERPAHTGPASTSSCAEACLTWSGDLRDGPRIVLSPEFGDGLPRLPRGTSSPPRHCRRAWPRSPRTSATRSARSTRSRPKTARSVRSSTMSATSSSATSRPSGSPTSTPRRWSTACSPHGSRTPRSSRPTSPSPRSSSTTSSSTRSTPGSATTRDGVIDVDELGLNELAEQLAATDVDEAARRLRRRQPARRPGRLLLRGVPRAVRPRAAQRPRRLLHPAPGRAIHRRRPSTTCSEDRSACQLGRRRRDDLGRGG